MCAQLASHWLAKKKGKKNSSAGPGDGLKIAEEISLLWSDFQQKTDCFPIPGAKTKPFLVIGLLHYLLFATELGLGSKYTRRIHVGGSVKKLTPISVATVLKYLRKHPLKHIYDLFFMPAMH